MCLIGDLRCIGRFFSGGGGGSGVFVMLLGLIVRILGGYLDVFICVCR